MVYEILSENNLCDYYSIESNPGVSQKFEIREGKFAFLDNEEIKKKLLSFDSDNHSRVVFYLPQMHCNSCIWLLENLHKVNESIVSSQVNFLRKEITVTFSKNNFSLRSLAELLARVGYEPHISLHDISSAKIKTLSRSQIFKIGISGFAFGNIMMLSFPEYFSSGHFNDEKLKSLFGFLNFALALPVFFYCASEFFVSGFKGLRQKILNIDAPIALAILITFSRSVYELLSGTGPGYFDSMTGIVFFMLVGRYFQNKTYQTISFDRDYTSYFPVGVSKIEKDGSIKQVPVSDLKEGDRIRIHAHEIIPADSILFLGKAMIDYSFVTGESVPVTKSIGEIVYAGGKQTGGALELEVIKRVSQSYLTQLWNNDVFIKNQKERDTSYIHTISTYFTYIVLIIALSAFFYWQMYNPSRAFHSLTSVLIVACPCALLLTSSFTYGNMLRVLQKFKFYLRNSSVIEALSETNAIVFDKTGTLTTQYAAQISYYGDQLTAHQAQLVRTLVSSSNHPLSKAIASWLPVSPQLVVSDFCEESGNGLSANIEGLHIKVGSAEFFGLTNVFSDQGSSVFISINEHVLGYFAIRNQYRHGLKNVISSLWERNQLYLISGDNENEKQELEAVFNKNLPLLFNQKPQDKLAFIQRLQEEGRKVVMLGDGLNDAGALMQSNTGIAISDNINNFSPASDALLDGKSFHLLPKLIDYCRKSKWIIAISFIISIVYNIIGLFYAVSGELQPVIAAILMPVSSISIVVITTGLSSWFASGIKVNSTLNC